MPDVTTSTIVTEKLLTVSSCKNLKKYFAIKGIISLFRGRYAARHNIILIVVPAQQGRGSHYLRCYYYFYYWHYGVTRAL
jgi:hypothetical protein